MKSITNIFKNKIVVAVICFVIAMIIAFIIVPSKNHDGERVNVIKVTKTISANTKITDDMLKEVNVEYDSVPSEAIRSKSDIVDKYAKSTIITQEKLSVIDTSSNLYSLKDGETAVSVTMKTLSKSVSGKILIGDAVQLYGYDTQEKEINPDSGQWYFEVLAIDNAKSENVSGANLNELSDIVPASITVKATSEEQVKSIVNMENNNDVQVVFAGRGEEAKKLLNR